MVYTFSEIEKARAIINGYGTRRLLKVLKGGQLEAQQFETPEVRSIFLLTGMLREHQDCLGVSVLERFKDFNPPIVLEEIERTIKRGKPMVTNSLLPYNANANQVLCSMVDYAQRLGTEHIGTEHLVYGLTVVEKSGASKELCQRGIVSRELDNKIRRYFRQPPVVANR